MSINGKCICYENNYKLDNHQFIITIGLAISSFVAFLSVYDTATGINDKFDNCAQDQALKAELQKKFIVMIVLAIAAIIGGFLMLGMLLRREELQHRGHWLFVPISIIITGMIGLIYAINMKTGKSKAAKIVPSLVLFGIFFGWSIIKGISGPADCRCEIIRTVYK